MSTGLSGEDRKAITRHLHAALWALEHDDQTGWRASIDGLIQWRTQPFMPGLARLARELAEALGEPGTPGAGRASLPEACARLEHVVKLTEEASMRSLDLIDECGTLLRQLPPPADDASAQAQAGIRSRLSELTAAQGYQDLTGQIIERVVALVRAVDEGLGEVIGEPERPLQLPGPSHGHGPAVAGVDPAPVSQDDANQLLSSLGL